VYYPYRHFNDCRRVNSCFCPGDFEFNPLIQALMMYIIYTIILAYITFVIVVEFLREKKWKNKVAMAMVLMIFILRLAQIK
jgi:hypothetical protein